MHNINQIHNSFLLGLTIFHGIFFTFSLCGGILREYCVEYCQSHQTLLWIWIMLCDFLCMHFSYHDQHANMIRKSKSKGFAIFLTIVGISGIALWDFPQARSNVEDHPRVDDELLRRLRERLIRSSYLHTITVPANLETFIVFLITLMGHGTSNSHTDELHCPWVSPLLCSRNQTPCQLPSEQAASRLPKFLGLSNYQTIHACLQGKLHLHQRRLQEDRSMLKMWDAQILSDRPILKPLRGVFASSPSNFPFANACWNRMIVVVDDAVIIESKHWLDDVHHFQTHPWWIEDETYSEFGGREA